MTTTPETKRPHRHRSVREKWRLVSINNKLVIMFAGLTMIATALYSGFAGWQLYEIHKGGKDTHDLAVAAQGQAKAAGAQVTEMIKQETDTHELATQAKNQADRTKDLADRALVQANATARIAKLTQDTLNVSQRAYVTVGRADGTVAEIIMPAEPNAKAAILVYFQNTGHLPARFNWGNSSPMIAVLPTDPKVLKDSEMQNTQWSDFDTEHVFQPMWRTKNLKQANSFGWTGTITIAGQSAYEGVLWEIPRERMLQLMNWDRPFMPTGKFEYCDGFGNRVCRRFGLRYAGNPYNKLFLASEEECATWEMQVLNPSPDVEYLNPCEVPEKREELKFKLKGSPKP